MKPKSMRGASAGSEDARVMEPRDWGFMRMTTSEK
jgi:hypothetical protein